MLPAQNVNSYLSEPDYIQNTIKYGGSHHEKITQIRDYLGSAKPLTFEECIVWARLQFEADYNNSIRQLLYSLPKDAVRTTAIAFALTNRPHFRKPAQDNPFGQDLSEHLNPSPSARMRYVPALLLYTWISADKSS